MFISLLTDFGIDQEYVGVMKAVVLRLCPSAVIIDISHTVSPYDVREGCFMLKNFVLYSPVGVHVAVIDPGVGTERRGIAIETERGDFLVGPDNGVLMEAAAGLKFKKAVALENKRYMLEKISSSFHGRDVFAPVAAHLVKGVPLIEFGHSLKEEELINSPLPHPAEDEKGIHGTVLRIDRFGNVQLNVEAERIHQKEVRTKIKGEERVLPFVKTFGEVREGALLLYEDPDGLITIAQNQGNAAHALKVERGEAVSLLSE